jgi:hypothetical protein
MKKIILGFVVVLLPLFHDVAAANIPLVVNLPAEAKTDASGLLREKIEALVKLQYPEKTIIDQVELTLDKSLPDGLNRNPEFSSLEAEYPGLINVICKAIRKPMLDGYAQKMPLLWSRVTDLYAENLTTADIDKITQFFNSPTAVRLRERAKTANDNSKLIDAAIVDAAHLTNGDSTTAIDKAARTMQANMTRKMMTAISSEDRIVIFKFENSSTGLKLNKMNSQMQKVMIDWDIYFTDEQKNDFMTARSEAISKFIEQAEAAKSKTTSK